jgi:gamma-glutamyltranspeptidase/glutathione hydrolase
MRDLHFPGRSVVYGMRGAAATSNPLSTGAAIQVLQNGGTAVDAALTACSLQSVIEPYNTGIGGDCFALVWNAKEKKLSAINGAGWAPAALSSEKLLDEGIKEIAETSIHAVTVPGAIDAWHHLLCDHGTRALADILAPTIDYAERGVVVGTRASVDWTRETELLRQDPGARAFLLDEAGNAPQPGSVVRYPRLAKTLRKLADEGRDGFYEGEIARDLVASLNELGGVHTLADFAEYRAQYIEPISTIYRGTQIMELPPSGQGLTVLAMLNILSGFDMAGMGADSADRYHVEMEATRLAYDLRDAYIADPTFADVPVEELLSAGFADRLRRTISMDKASPADRLVPRVGQTDTVYVTVVDGEGNVCSLINSLFHAFGNRKVCPRTGIVFQSRGSGFRVKPDHPNAVAPRKRPLHTIIPSMAFRDGVPVASFGVIGGPYQCVGQVHLIQNLLDFGMDVQSALDHPRGFGLFGAFEAERGISEDVMTSLAARGHVVKRSPVPFGGGQAILIDPATGLLSAGSDPRMDGCALAF